MEPIKRGHYTNDQLAELLDEERAKNQAWVARVDELEDVIRAVMNNPHGEHCGKLEMAINRSPRQSLARLKAEVLDAAWLSLSAQAGGPEGYKPKSQRYLLDLLRCAADSFRSEAGA